MGSNDNWKNKLYYGDNLHILRDHIASECVDLIYLDPPFNSNATYNLLFKEKDGKSSEAQIEAFDDTWQWDIGAEETYVELVQNAPEKLSKLIEALRMFLGSNDMMAYLVMMAARLIELHRVLKPTGSIYLHCDPTASHYLKLVMDAVFGVDNYRNEIIWKRTFAHNDPNRWGRVHDLIYFYTKCGDYYWSGHMQPYSEQYLKSKYRYQDRKGTYRLVVLTAPGTTRGDSCKEWRGINPLEKGRHWSVPSKIIESLVDEKELSNLTVQEKLDVLDKNGFIYWPNKTDGIPEFKQYLGEGVPIQDVIIDIPPINSQAKERLGYPTQKPEALLERIVKASSGVGDVVLDPFCGCGTAVAVAERLGRRWIGIDITHLSITLMKKRLEDTFGSDLAPYEVFGEPEDLSGAKALFRQDPYQFQWWSLGLVDGKPAGGERKKGADRGIDGYINFFDEPGKVKRVIISVKGGKVQSPFIRDLKGVVDRENAQIGLLITLEPPTKPMLKEAAEAGFYESPLIGKKYPKIQILTIEELVVEGKTLDYPKDMRLDMFTKAKKQSKEEKEEKLFN